MYFLHEAHHTLLAQRNIRAILNSKITSKTHKTTGTVALNKWQKGHLLTVWELKTEEWCLAGPQLGMSKVGPITFFALLHIHTNDRRSATSMGECTNTFSDQISCSVVSDSLPPHGLYNLWNSPGQNTGVGSCILQGIPFSRGSSQPRDQTQVSCIADGFFISWATREVQEYWSE